MGSYAALSNLPFRGLRASSSMMLLMRTTVRVWQEARAIFGWPHHVSLHTPLWGNPMLPHFVSIPDPSLWAKKGITSVKHIVQDGRLNFPGTAQCLLSDGLL